MGILDDVRSVGRLIQKIGNMDLYKKVLDLQGNIIGLVEENNRLRNEVESLKVKLQIKESLKFERNSYWSKKSDGTQDGPFCSKCWDTEKLLVRMLPIANPAYCDCPNCKVRVNISGRLPKATKTDDAFD